MSIASGLDAALALELGALETFHVEVISCFGPALGCVASGVFANQADGGHDVTLDIVDCFHALSVVVFRHLYCELGGSGGN